MLCRSTKDLKDISSLNFPRMVSQCLSSRLAHIREVVFEDKSWHQALATERCLNLAASDLSVTVRDLEENIHQSIHDIASTRVLEAASRSSILEAEKTTSILLRLLNDRHPLSSVIALGRVWDEPTTLPQTDSTIDSTLPDKGEALTLSWKASWTMMKRCCCQYLPRCVRMYHPMEGGQKRRVGLLVPGQHESHASFSLQLQMEEDYRCLKYKRQPQQCQQKSVPPAVIPTSWKTGRWSAPSSTRRLGLNPGRRVRWWMRPPPTAWWTPVRPWIPRLWPTSLRRNQGSMRLPPFILVLQRMMVRRFRLQRKMRPKSNSWRLSVRGAIRVWARSWTRRMPVRRRAPSRVTAWPKKAPFPSVSWRRRPAMSNWRPWVRASRWGKPRQTRSRSAKARCRSKLSQAGRWGSLGRAGCTSRRSRARRDRLHCHQKLAGLVR